MSFAQLREILCLKPSEETWKELLSLFENWQGSDLAIAIDYTHEHLRSWPDIISEGYIIQRKVLLMA